MSQSEHEPEKVKAEPLSLSRLVDGKPSEPEHWQRVAREFAAHGERHLVDLDVSSRDSGKPEDVTVVDRDIRDAEVVAKLILASKLLKEAIEIGVARAKRGPVIALAKRSDLNHAAGRAMLV